MVIREKRGQTAGLKKIPYKPNNHNKLKHPWLLKLKNSITVSEKLTKVHCLFKERSFAIFKKKLICYYIWFSVGAYKAVLLKVSELSESVVKT